MQINKKLLASIFVVSLLTFCIGYGTLALFSDTETSSGNNFNAGTLYISLETGTWSTGFDNMKPGDTVTFTITVKSEGTLPLDYTIITVLSGDLAEGANPCTFAVKIDGELTASDSLSELYGDDDSDVVVISITMPIGAGNGYQGKSGDLTVTFDAVQQ